MVEVLIDDLGYDELKKPVKKPLDGLKFAGYVGCQTNRPFGIAGETPRCRSPSRSTEHRPTISAGADRTGRAATNHRVPSSPGLLRTHSVSGTLLRRLRRNPEAATPFPLDLRPNLCKPAGP
jgi:hypothetical protein